MRASRALLKGCCLIGFGMQRQPAERRVNDNRRMPVRIAALLVWALAAASAVFWGARAFSAAKPIPPGAAVAPNVTVATGGPLNKVLGMTLVARTEEADPVDEDSRFRLLGVVAPRTGSIGGGVALISVGDEPAKPFRVGATIDGDAVLLAVAMRRAEIGPRGGPASVQLELPSPDSASASSMPSGQPPMPQPGANMQRPMPPSGLPQPGARSAGEIMPVRPPLQAPSAPHQPQASDMNDEEEE
jgi:general secretion pathway protein C